MPDSELSKHLPEGWAVTHINSFKSFKVMELKTGKEGVLKLLGPAIIERLYDIEEYGYTPKIIWEQNNYAIIEWIFGIHWKGYIDKIGLTDELARWYILENWKIFNIIGGHGDFVWYNIIITPDIEVKWIDIGTGNSKEAFINQMWMHTNRMYTKEEIEEMLP